MCGGTACSTEMAPSDDDVTMMSLPFPVEELVDSGRFAAEPKWK